MNEQRERNSSRARRLRLIVAIGLGIAMMAARRTNTSQYGCRRGFLPYGGSTVAFVGNGTSTFGEQSLPASFLTADPGRRMYLLSDTSAQTYVFDQDITNTTQRYGAGTNIPCGVYATRGDAFCTDDCSDDHSQSADFVSLCGVPLGQDVRVACQGRACPTCTLYAPPECFVRNAERLNYVPDATIEAPLPLKSAQLPWDFDRDAVPQDFAMSMDAAGTQPWPNPIRSVRSHDTGACRLNIPWPQLATLVDGAFLQLFIDTLQANTGVQDIFNAHVDGSAGPQLRGTPTATFDEVFLRNEVYAYIKVEVPGIPYPVERHMSGIAFTRFSLSTTTNAAGFARVSVPYVTAWSDHLPTTPWEVGEDLAKTIPGAQVFPTAFSGALRDAMLIPAFTSLGAVVECAAASSPAEESPPNQAGVAECSDLFADRDAPPPGMQSHFAGPERGCYPRSALAGVWGGLLPANASGICATRLQARNVNLLRRRCRSCSSSRASTTRRPTTWRAS